MAWTLIAIGVVALLALWLVPKLQLHGSRKYLIKPEITLSDLLKAENDRRVAVAQILGGLAVLAGLFYSSQTVRLQERGQLTDRINKAVEQLGSTDVTGNLGGIHQLARIADDYDDERYPMLQVLTSFIEEKRAIAPLQVSGCEALKERQNGGLPAAASQAVVDVLGKQVGRLTRPAGPLYLNHADLSYVDFSGGSFGNIQLAGDDLTGAHLDGTHFDSGSVLAFSQFTYADLTDSRLSGVRLHNACMSQARLRRTNLSGADLSFVDFRRVEDMLGTDLTGANLAHADVRGVDLSEVKGLTEAQLEQVTCDEFTLLPAQVASLHDKLRCSGGIPAP